MALYPGHYMVLEQQITVAVTKIFARKFEKKPLLLNSTQRIFSHHDFTKKLEQNTPKHLIFANCCFSSASISTLPSVSFQSYMTVIFRLYKILLIFFFFWLTFLCFPFSPHGYHFFSSSIFYTTPSKSDEILFSASLFR